MSVLLISINAVIPLFIVIAVGFFIGKKGLIDEKMSKNLSTIAFKILMPFHLFTSIYNGAAELKINYYFLLIIVVIEILSFVISVVLAKLVSKKKAQIGTILQAVFRANMIVFGLPIAYSILTDNEVATFTISLLLILPLQTFGSILGRELFGDSQEKVNWGNAVVRSIIDPNMIAMALGVVAVMTSIVLPEFLMTGIKDVGKVASPLCLFLIGAGFRFDGIKDHIKEISAGVLGRLFIMPLICVPIVLLFDIPFVEKFIIMILCSAPTATSVYTIVEEGGLDRQLAKELIVISTLLSLVSLTIWIYVLQVIN